MRDTDSPPSALRSISRINFEIKSLSLSLLFFSSSNWKRSSPPRQKKNTYMCTGKETRRPHLHPPKKERSSQIHLISSLFPLSSCESSSLRMMIELFC